MRALRVLLSALLAVSLIGALFSSTAGASDRSSSSSSSSASGGGNSRLTFKKPVSLTSFAPVRTATGTAYTATRGDQPSDHEWSGEPSIQIDEKGTIYVAGTCCLAAASPVWYSSDGGKKFKEMETPGHVREWGVGAEGDLAVDDEGRTYFVDTYIPGLLMSRWSENGTKWDFTVPAAGVTPGFDDRPWIAWSAKGLYLYVNHVSHTAVYRSADGGMSWDGGHILLWRGEELGQPFFPAHIAADRKKGTLWVAGVVEEKGRSVLGSAVTEDNDGDFKFREAVVSEPQRRGGFSPIFTGATAVDAAGNGYTTWSTFDEKGCDVHYAVSTNKGKSWQEPVKVNTGKGCATFPWIAAGDDGKIALAWYETPASKSSSTTRDFLGLTSGRSIYNGLELPLAAYQDELPEQAPWFLHAAAIPNATAKKPSVIEARIDTKTPVLTGPMKRELWDFLQLAIGSDGRIVISFVKKFQDGAPQTWYVESKTGPRLK